MAFDSPCGGSARDENGEGHDEGGRLRAGILGYLPGYSLVLVAGGFSRSVSEPVLWDVTGAMMKRGVDI